MTQFNFYTSTTISHIVINSHIALSAEISTNIKKKYNCSVLDRGPIMSIMRQFQLYGIDLNKIDLSRSKESALKGLKYAV